MKYVIGTGYFDNGKTSADFFKTWMTNTLRFSVPTDIVVVNAASKPLASLGGTWLNMMHNYGHVKAMAPGEKYGGWWLGFMMSALTAYHHDADFIYKEQDCLAFGPWVDRLYEDGRTAHVVVGRFNHKYRIEQSLVLVRRKFIPELIMMYLSINDTDVNLRPELKFLQIMSTRPGCMVCTSMGCGRNRPIPYNDKCFYAQKLSASELGFLASRQLI